MRKFAFLPLLLVCAFAGAQENVNPVPVVDNHVMSATPKDSLHKTYVPKSTMVTLCVGIVDGYRSGYSYPAGFEKKGITGFAPISAKLEYGLSKNVSLAAGLGYDAFTNSYYQSITGNGVNFKRVITNNIRVYSLGLSAYYHLGHAIRVKNLDPFVGVGVAVNNYTQSAFPQGDSTVSHSEHPVTASIKIGARYYISDRGSIYLDAGYEKQSMINVGVSCRFFKK